MSLTPVLAMEMLLLLLAANGAPVLAKRVLGERFNHPLDSGKAFIDGRPVLGRSKTYRGLVSGVLACTLAALVMGYAWHVGALFGLLSLTGDALSSFIKRRLGIASSGMALGLDQIPEALLPLWLLREALGLDAMSVFVLAGLFFAGELLLSRIMYRLHVRDRPY